MRKNILKMLVLAGMLAFNQAQAYEGSAKDAVTNWTTEKKTAGGVTITATFRNPEDIWDPGYLVFYVQLDSDTVTLDSVDFEKDIWMRDDNEWTYLPSRVIVQSGSGSHREAVLSFIRSKKKPTFIELYIRKPDAAAGTIFKWWSMRTLD